jgi:hypothetical protein
LRALAALQAGLPQQLFLFGSRPSLADFGLFGQLQILASDPTPAAIMRSKAPHVHTWLMRLDDASGVEGHWQPVEQPLSPMVLSLLRLAAEAYLPFLQANAVAIEEGRDALSVQIMGTTFTQAPFRYQAKCWHVLRQTFTTLPPAAMERTVPILRDTGCLEFLI